MTVDEVILSLAWAPSTSNFISFNNSSSAEHSLVRLEQPRAHYCVGDTLNVLVEMRNYAGHPKAYGGDFILARIYSPNLKAGASGDVTDFFNGSYRVRFRLFWPGEVQVSVRLIHSSESVKILQRDWMHDYSKATHMGTFISGGKKETSKCALRLSSDRPLCEYRKKEDGDYYACYRPKTLPCNSLTTTKSYVSPGPSLTKEEAQLLANEDAITKCLKGKTLYILGDSTARQWIEYLGSKLKGLKLIKNGAESSVAFDADSNITVRWVRHYHPWGSSRPVTIKGTVTIPEVLDSIAVDGGMEDVQVVIGIGQHFRLYPPELFIRRLQNIRRAILRLLARSPKASVVIKLENIRELNSMMTHLYSNWYGYMQNQAQRKVFEDMKVAIVDAWDMTVAANSFAVHPNAVIVSNELAVALSFFCH
ncbi:NXPE family member 4-like [Osmerus eperlanus]|uniref:NXPE family member 4-like n=1 Tax=Osmerus eperlanus TaxID=29151 RepID=UPI002E0D83D1